MTSILEESLVEDFDNDLAKSVLGLSLGSFCASSGRSGESSLRLRSNVS
jgi:hypothetical protein